MEDQIVLTMPAYKLNKAWTIWVAAFLGGPLAGAYLMAENFKQLGDPKKAKLTWGISIIVTIVVFAAAKLIPNREGTSNYFLPVLYIGLSQYLVKRFQQQAITLHGANGGAFYPWIRAIVVGVLGTVLMVILIIGVHLMIGGANSGS